MKRIPFINRNGMAPKEGARTVLSNHQSHCRTVVNQIRGATIFNGGAGSGNWGHAGRPGERGGAAKGDGGDIAPGGFIHEDKTMRINPTPTKNTEGDEFHEVSIKGQADGQKPIDLKIPVAAFNEIKEGKFPSIPAQVRKWGINDGDLDGIHEKVGYIPVSKLKEKLTGDELAEASRNNAIAGQYGGKARAYITRARDYAPEETAHKVLLVAAARALDIAAKASAKLAKLRNSLAPEGKDCACGNKNCLTNYCPNCGTDMKKDKIINAPAPAVETCPDCKKPKTGSGELCNCEVKNRAPYTYADTIKMIRNLK